MDFYAQERIAIFIDGASLYMMSKSIDCDIDYKRLLDLFRQKGRLVRALYYTTINEDAEYNSIRPLIDWLEYNGYTVITKIANACSGGSGRHKSKSSMDVELAVDAMRLSVELDHIVLFSGDGDFRSLVAALQMNGLRVSIVSTLQTQPAMVADELRRQADQFIDLVHLGKLISRETTTRNTQGVTKVRPKIIIR
jgi:uncharacterized LabA/DUF88 family protein